MKKSLVALATLAATGAMAQVTISGLVDFANANVGGTQLHAKGSTISTTVGTSATSVIRIGASEDIGGGMKVFAQYNLDPRTLANDSFSVTNNKGTGGAVGSTSTTIGATTAQANTITGLARDEMFVGISGGFGNLRLGSPNSIGLNAFVVGSPLGTGIGSGFSAGSTAGTMTAASVAVRHNRSIRFDSPTINGFAASVLYAPGNDQAQLTTTPADSATQAVPQALLIPNSRQFTEVGLRYDNGPLSVAAVNISTKAQTNAGGYYVAGTNVAGAKTSYNMVNASYKIGATTLYAGTADGDQFAITGTTATPTKSTRYGIKHTVGAVDLAAMSTTQKDTTAETKRTVTGFRVDYNFSKTAAAYLGYEKYDSGAAYSNAGSTLNLTGTRTITSVGLRKSF